MTTFKQGLILVEGQTEEDFVNDLLNPHLHTFGLNLTPILAVTSRLSGGSSHKGGIVSYGKVKFQVQQLLKNSGATVVTTMIDFYGLRGKDFPGSTDLDTKLKHADAYRKVAHLESAFQKDIDHIRFLPYFALHEYESILFTGVEVFPVWLTGLPSKALEALQSVRQTFENPELINDLKPPSIRIQEILSEYRIHYDKVSHGVFIAQEIGLNAIRQHCPHFDEWLTKLEQLAR